MIQVSLLKRRWRSQSEQSTAMAYNYSTTAMNMPICIACLSLCSVSNLSSPEHETYSAATAVTNRSLVDLAHF